MKHRLLPVVLLSATVLTLSGCIAGLTYTAGSSGSTYVFLDSTTETSDVYTSQILGYPIASTGTVSPAITLTAPTNEVLISAATDASGNVYTLTQAAPNYRGGGLVPQINVYDPTSSTPSTPVRTITIPLYPAPAQNAFASPAPAPVATFAVDPRGNIYVAYFDVAGTMVKYGPSAADVGSTPATPALTLTGITKSYVMTTDSSGNLYDVQFVQDLSGDVYNVINVYNAGFTTSTPARTINPTTIPGTNDTYFYGITVDGSGNVYTTTFIDPDDDPEITIFSPTANVTPTTTIVGSATTLTEYISGIALDSAGNIYVRDASVGARAVSGPVADTFSPEGMHPPTIVDKFAANASGNAAPVSSLSTGIDNQFFSSGLAIH